MGDSNLRKISQAEQRYVTGRKKLGTHRDGGVWRARTKRKESSRKLRIVCHEDGATLKLVAAGDQRSL